MNITTTRGPDGLPTVKVTYVAELAGVPTLVPTSTVPAINGSVTIAVKPNVISVSRERDAFPSLGVYRTKNGQTDTIIRDKESELGPLGRLTGIQTDKGSKDVPR